MWIGRTGTSGDTFPPNYIVPYTCRSFEYMDSRVRCNLDRDIEGATDESIDDTIDVDHDINYNGYVGV